MSQVLRQRIVGRHQLPGGTTCPVVDQVRRETIGRKRYWLVLYGVVNDEPTKVERFTARREAYARYQESAPC